MGQDLFSRRLLNWFDQHGRHDLPWQQQPSLYRVWVSEIMLQQTQVYTVIPYYARFMQRFPDINSLAVTSQDEVLKYWAGLGYYARGRNLHKAAQFIEIEHGGCFPEKIDAVQALPGIGQSTAGAILALALNQRHPILDGNVKRSLCRYHGIEGYPGIKSIEKKLWELAEQHTPIDRPGDYTQAIMDMGATLCNRSRPDCAACPHQTDCVAFKQGCVQKLPTSRPKRVKPHKHRYMLILSDSDENVAAFKRPEKGIWGGLYSLPEFDGPQSCREFISHYASSHTMHHCTGADIKHSFTHFDLDITPVYLRFTPDSLSQVLLQLQDFTPQFETGVDLSIQSKQNYDSGNSATHRGLPAPVHTILKYRPTREEKYSNGIFTCPDKDTRINMD